MPKILIILMILKYLIMHILYNLKLFSPTFQIFKMITSMHDNKFLSKEDLNNTVRLHYKIQN